MNFRAMIAPQGGMHLLRENDLGSKVKWKMSWIGRRGMTKRRGEGLGPEATAAEAKRILSRLVKL